jgi:hypothetical protein
MCDYVRSNADNVAHLLPNIFNSIDHIFNLFCGLMPCPMWGGSLNFVITAGSGYFKNLKEPPGFMKQSMTTP